LFNASHRPLIITCLYYLAPFIAALFIVNNQTSIIILQVSRADFYWFKLEIYQAGLKIFKLFFQNMPEI